MTADLTRTELLAAARRTLGYPIKPDQFKALRVAGLVPKPQPHARKSGHPTYPPGTLEQLVAVRRLHDQERRFDELRLLVWWNGYWVAHDQLVQSLAKILDDGVADIRAIRAARPEPEEAAEAVLDMFGGAHGSRSPVVRLFRYRMGRDDEDLRSALYTILVLAFGGEPIWHVEDVGLDEAEESPEKLVEKLMGVSRLSDEIEGAGPLVSGLPDTRSNLRALRDAGVFDLENPGRVFLSTSAADLEIARCQAHALMEDFGNAAQLIVYRQGRDAAGLGLLPVMRKRDVYWTHAFTVRYWLLAPSILPADAIAEFVDALQENRKTISAALELIEAFPGYKPFLTPGGDKRLADLPAEEREQISRTLIAYQNDHPRARFLLENEVELG